jgi:hypothetical protein
MTGMLAALAAIGAMALVATPAGAAERRADGVRNVDQIEVSAQRRYYRGYRGRPYVRPRYYYGRPNYYRRPYYEPYYAYGYYPYGYYRPYRYYRPGPYIGFGPFGFGVGLGW